MFTGIVEEVGKIARIQRGTNSAVLSILAEKVLEDTKIGDSIAVNGVCLTVTKTSRGQFSADVMHETLSRSGLAALRSGSPVNLERALSANGRFGGHIVSGHIDGVGTVSKVVRDDNAIRYTIRAEQAILRYIVEKGSIAIDGISLTVAEVDDAGFSVSVIPHTLQETTLADRKLGDPVNLEVDVVGKYVEKLLGAPTANRISMDFLQQHGF